MAKRYTDTGIHRKVWFRSLDLRLREAWRILCAECDLIGVWEIDMASLCLWVGQEVTLKDLIEAFDLKEIGDNKIWIPGFAAFQYGDEEGVISWNNKLTQKIIRMLRAKNLPLPRFKNMVHPSELDPPSIHHASPTHGVKDKDKDKDIVPLDLDLGKGSPEGKGFDLSERAAQIFKSVPLITHHTLSNQYPPEFLKAGIEEAVLFHLNEAAACNWRPAVWGKKITAWLIEKKRREKGTGVKRDSLEDLVLPDYSKGESAQ